MPADANVLTAKRLGLWHHALRNRLVARIAQAFRAGNHDEVRKMFPNIVRVARPASRDGVVVLVENIEHALVLSRRLLGWPVLTGLEVCKEGLTPEQAKRLRPPSPFGETNPLYAIVTPAGINARDLTAVGALVRADGGVGLPDFLEQALIEPAADVPSPLLLIDFHDRHHPLLRRWSRRRQEAYAERGWFAPGVDPIQTRVERFLATRPKGVSR